MSRVVAAGCSLLILLGLITGCISGDDSNEPDVEPTPEPLPGQITRPADPDIALDNAQAVDAFKTAERFLVAWLFLRQPDQALREVSSDRRPTMEPILEGSQVDGACRLTQIVGTAPDENGVTTAQYRIEACQILPAGADEAARQLTVTIAIAEQRPWVVALSFEQSTPVG